MRAPPTGTPSKGAADARLIVDSDQLFEVFRNAEKPESHFRIGVEAEKIGVIGPAGTPLPYEDAESTERPSITGLFRELATRGWEPHRETAQGPVISLERAGDSITLEPGAQLELSGRPEPDVHRAIAGLRSHLEEIQPYSESRGLRWLGVGFHPLARLSDLPWVPKQRYAIMKKYLPTRGPGAHDMMQRTATVQANFDFSSEADALRKLRVMLRLSPVLNAIGANSPFVEGAKSEYKSRRGQVWLEMDPDRSGLLPRMWSAAAGYRDYVEWALDAPMFLVRRGDEVLANTGQTFRAFLKDGFGGERANEADWKLHLSTLFPEVRMKNTLELRCADTLPLELTAALIALFTGLMYDARALDEAERLTSDFDFAGLERVRPELVRQGLAATLFGKPLRKLAEEVVEAARAGLERRACVDAAGRNEARLLEPLIELVQRGETPADRLLARYAASAGSVDDLIRCADIYATS
jgi:glutamate--cysteine ligase